MHGSKLTTVTFDCHKIVGQLRRRETASLGCGRRVCKFYNNLTLIGQTCPYQDRLSKLREDWHATNGNGNFEVSEFH